MIVTFRNTKKKSLFLHISLVLQNKIRLSDGVEKQKHFSKLDNLKQQLCDLEKKYEESKPLVNLVDNMVS